MWVDCQRWYYEDYRNGKASPLTKEKVQALNAIGFMWKVVPDSDKLWTARFEELKRFKNSEGHCLVPERNTRNPFLGTWVRALRHSYKNSKEGKPSQLSESRIKALEKL